MVILIMKMKSWAVLDVHLMLRALDPDIDPTTSERGRNDMSPSPRILKQKGEAQLPAGRASKRKRETRIARIGVR